MFIRTGAFVPTCYRPFLASVLVLGAGLGQEASTSTPQEPVAPTATTTTAPRPLYQLEIQAVRCS
jgi:hypothetical protein